MNTLTSSHCPLRRALAASLLTLGALGSAHAQEQFTYMTNWYAQAEHGGFYQAVATGIYKKLGSAMRSECSRQVLQKKG